MTTRLYYSDAELRAFHATVVASEMVDGRAHLVLDQTAFYPTSGGQPFDTGRLGDDHVLDVIDRDDGAVVHVVTSPRAVGETVHAEIDWPRRLDHMQQHTGQHVLSAAFDRRYGVRTVSFHMGVETSTIDLAREVTRAEIDDAEADANVVVWENRPVTVRFVTAEEASQLPLRKEPARAGVLRLVDVEDFDLSACGGTHVPRTGAIGLIAIAGSERFKGATRVTFVCGRRALRSHGALRDAIAAATRVVSVPPAELGPYLQRLQQEQKDTDRRVRTLEGELAAYRATVLAASAETIGPYRVVLQADAEWDGAALKTLSVAILQTGSGLVAVLVGGGDPVPVLVARSAGVDLDAGALIKEAVAALGGRGGGRPEQAQAGITATGSRVVTFLRQALAR